MEEPALCAGVNADGQTACRYRALPGSSYCARHGVRSGVEQPPLIVASYEETSAAPEEHTEDLKAALAALRSNSSPLVVNAILDTLANAGRLMSYDCSCGRRNRVSVPDHAVRLKAAEMAINNSIGKPGFVEPVDNGPIAPSADIANMSIPERNALKARLLARLGETDA